MKTLLIALILLSVNVNAQESCTTTTEKVGEVKEDVNTPTPKQLEGATILVKMKDGTVKEMKAEQFKVVPRKQQFKVKERVLVEKTNCQPKVVEKEVVKKQEMHRNIISLYAVSSQRGLNRDDRPSEIEVQTKRSLGVGVMYQRRVSERIYLGIGADTNRGAEISAGLGF